MPLKKVIDVETRNFSHGFILRNCIVLNMREYVVWWCIYSMVVKSLDSGVRAHELNSPASRLANSVTQGKLRNFSMPYFLSL